MEQQHPKFWFPAKRYGWGWGWPCAWQGWLVFVAYFLLLVLGFVFFPPQRDPGSYAVYTGLISLGLVGICYLKGEPPRWQWGGRK